MKNFKISAHIPLYLKKKPYNKKKIKNFKKVCKSLLELSNKFSNFCSFKSKI